MHLQQSTITHRWLPDARSNSARFRPSVSCLRAIKSKSDSWSPRETIARWRSLFLRKAKLEELLNLERRDWQSLVRRIAIEIHFSEEELWQKKKMPHPAA